MSDTQTLITTIDGTALPLPGQDIDTDRIIPARFLKAISFEGLEAHVFEDDRASLRQSQQIHPFDDPRFTNASVLVVNRNFGCGSSREHAPQALKRWGIHAVVGQSFSEIFFGNSLALGLPCVSIPDKEGARLLDLVQREPETQVHLDLQTLTLDAGSEHFKVSLPKPAQEALLTGAWNATSLLLTQFDEVESVASRLPYVSGFTSAKTR